MTCSVLSSRFSTFMNEIINKISIQPTFGQILFLIHINIPLASHGIYDDWCGIGVILEEEVPKDPSLSSVIYLVPRMIIMNPIFGIGIGNYSLVRNDPKYLKGLPVYYQWDQHSLGLIGYLPEFGIPLFLLFIYLLFKPVYWSLKIKPRGLTTRLITVVNRTGSRMVIEMESNSLDSVDLGVNKTFQSYVRCY